MEKQEHESKFVPYEHLSAEAHQELSLCGINQETTMDIIKRGNYLTLHSNVKINNSTAFNNLTYKQMAELDSDLIHSVNFTLNTPFGKVVLCSPLTIHLTYKAFAPEHLPLATEAFKEYKPEAYKELKKQRETIN